jgi:hypothetical protein
MYVLQWVQDRAEQVRTTLASTPCLANLYLSSVETYIMWFFLEIR